MSDQQAEMRALLTRAACAEAARQSAIARQDFAAVRELETELGRIWARYCDLEAAACERGYGIP